MWNRVNPFPICKSHILLSYPGGFTEQIYSGKVKYTVQRWIKYMKLVHQFVQWGAVSLTAVRLQEDCCSWDKKLFFSFSPHNLLPLPMYYVCACEIRREKKDFSKCQLPGKEIKHESSICFLGKGILLYIMCVYIYTTILKS